MKKLVIASIAASLSTVALTGTSFAGGFGGGASQLGQNPDALLTIAERQQLQALRRSGKIKNIYQSSANRLRAIEEDRWYLERYKRTKRRD